jgi:hypothetical protein
MDVQHDKHQLDRMLAYLRKDNRLANRVRAMQARHLQKKIYVMGCGRSGTWLFLSMFSTFDDTRVLARELPMEYWGLLMSESPCFVFKRYYDSYKRIALLPREVHLAWMIRHPFDVLTSHNPASGRQYHIDGNRWRGEMSALKQVIESQRLGLEDIYRYEDMAMNPLEFQLKLACDYGLTPKLDWQSIPDAFVAGERAKAAMHGLRKIDTASINAFRHNPAKLEYLHQIRPKLGSLLDWVGRSFGYDIRL